MSIQIKRLNSIPNECQELVQQYPWKPYRHHSVTEEASARLMLENLERAVNDAHTALVGLYENDTVRALSIFREQPKNSEVLGLLQISLDALYYTPLQNAEQKLDALIREALCQVGRCGIVTALLPEGDLAGIHALEKNGFNLMATNVTYAIGLKNKNLRLCEYAQGRPRSTDIREFRREEIPLIIKLARDAYSTYNGHLHNNFRIKPECATEYYVREIQDACEKGAATVLVATLDNEVVGFSTCHWLEDINKHAGKRIGEVVYSGIAEKARGKSLYTEKILQCLEWFQQKGGDSVEVNANINNIAVIHAWQKLGFRFAATRYRFHKNNS